MNIFRNMRLKPSILTSFVVLTVPVFFTIIAVTYFSNDRIARANAQGLVERFRNEAIDNIQDDFSPIKSLARSAAAISAAAEPSAGTVRESKVAKSSGLVMSTTTLPARPDQPSGRKG